MSNTHYNGKEPYEMSDTEYDKQAEIWKENCGHIRVDQPHGGTNYPHSHWYDSDDKNNDFVVVRKDDDDDDDDDDDS